MTAAVITVVGSLLVAVVAAAAPSMSAKQQRELALLEADLRDRLPEGSGERERLDRGLSHRIYLWSEAHVGAAAWMRLAIILLAIATALMGLRVALGYWLDPLESAERLRRMAHGTFAGLEILAGLVLLGGVMLAVVGAVVLVRTRLRRAGSPKGKRGTQGASRGSQNPEPR